MNAPFSHTAITTELARDTDLSARHRDAVARVVVRRQDERLRQLAQLTAIVKAAEQARVSILTTSNFALFESHEGAALVNAMHDLTEVDALYDLAGDVRHAAGVVS